MVGPAAKPHSLILSHVLLDAAPKLSPEAFRAYVVLLAKIHAGSPGTELVNDEELAETPIPSEIIAEINKADLPYKISMFYQVQGWPLKSE